MEEDYLNTMLQSIKSAGQGFQAANENQLKKQQLDQEATRNAALNANTALQTQALQSDLTDKADQKTRADQLNKQFQDLVNNKLPQQQQTVSDTTAFDQAHGPAQPVDEGQKVDLAQQAMNKYPSLGNLPGQSVMQKTDITPAAAQASGYTTTAPTAPDGLDLAKGRTLAKMSNVQQLNAAGGMGLSGTPQMDKLYTGAQAQDKEVQDAKEKDLARTQQSTENDLNRTNQKQMHDDTVANTLAIAEMNNTTKQSAQSSKGDSAVDKDWEKIQNKGMLTGRGVNATTRTAQQTLVNANRALMLLSKPIQTPQDANTISADFNQIFSGHSATDYGISEQTYKTLQSKAAQAGQFWSGNPQQALPDNIKTHLSNILGDLKTQNIGIIKDYLDELELGHSSVIGEGAKYENDWQKLRAKMLNGGGYMQQLTGNSGSPASAATMRYNPQTGKIEPVGQQ